MSQMANSLLMLSIQIIFLDDLIAIELDQGDFELEIRETDNTTHYEVCHYIKKGIVQISPHNCCIPYIKPFKLLT